MANDPSLVPRRGRGVLSNRAGRFESLALEADGDARDHLAREAEAEGDPSPPRTQVLLDSTRTIIARNESPDIPFDRSINPYRGCEHGCVYCFARPSHAWLGMSAGLDFETRILAKPRAAELLRAALRRPGYRVRPIAMGTNTDPYQPVERERRITRSILEVLESCNHPLSIVTKSALILRDLDLLAPMAERRLFTAAVSVTTLDRDLHHRMEPRAALPEVRLRTIRSLAQAGVPVMVMAAPMIPGLNDQELEAIIEAAGQAGAHYAGTILVRLPHEVEGLFTEWLRHHYPARAKRVLSLIRQCREGVLYRGGFGKRMTGEGPYAEMLLRRLRAARRRFGLDRPPPLLDCDAFHPPPADARQMSLF